MSRALTVFVHLHDGRYHGLDSHGSPEWPPSPARLFQALIAGAAGGHLPDDLHSALQWLEMLDPPVIGAPRAHLGQRFTIYVPNNDLDSVGGDPNRTSEIRDGKWVKSHLLADAPMLLYAWPLSERDDDKRHAGTVCAMADRLYQLGRGVDMAWAWGEVLNEEDLEARLSDYPGLVYRPSGTGRGRTLACPRAGSLASLVERYAANSKRFQTDGNGRASRIRQAPKARFAQIPYESPPWRHVYVLLAGKGEGSFAVWPLERASMLVTRLRDEAVAPLRRALPHLDSDIERFMVGRKANGSDDGPTHLRVRIVPLPSIGHPYADHGIRRVLVEVPAGCPLRADDVHWAFSGLRLVVPATGEILDVTLTSSGDETMLTHYGMADHTGSRVWRTVTPVALPEPARLRRIEAAPGVEAKDGSQRAAEQARAAAAVVQALRHAGIRTRVETVRVQREPLEARGERAETFAPETRFAKERLWHMEITFNTPVQGPVVIGDGRFLGLGVMAPSQQRQGVHAFVVEDGLAAMPEPAGVARALRRAIMARVQAVLGARTSLSTFFTGHERDGSPAQTEQHPHLSFAFDPESARILLVAPHIVHGRVPTREEERHLGTLEAALTGFRELRAGSAGHLMLRAISIDIDSDPLFAASRIWESVTPYQVTRHSKRANAADVLAADLLAECRRRGLPEPHVTPHGMQGIPGVGLVGRARLTFEVAVAGPLILGKNRHLGGGLFAGTASVGV